MALKRIKITLFYDKDTFKNEIKSYSGQMDIDELGQVFAHLITIRDLRLVQEQEKELRCNACGRTLYPRRYFDDEVEFTAVVNQEVELFCEKCA